MNPQEDIALTELSVVLTQKHDLWWRALQAGEYVWAAYYANDLEAISRRLATITHHYVKDHYADPQAALGRHLGSPIPPAKGDRG